MIMGCSAVCLLAVIYSRITHSDGSFPWYGIIPPVLAVMLAVVTSRIRLSLAAAVISGGFLAAIADSNGFAVWLANGLGRTWLFAIQTVWRPESGTFNIGNVRILLYVVLIMAMISVMLAAGGLQGVARWLEKYARSARSTQLATMAILIPTAIPVAFSLDGNVYGTLTVVSVAAILDGAIFGDHCSPLSDTTIMSSTASSCDHLAHVATQIPYSLCVAAIALGVGYLPAALGVPGWCSAATGVVLLASLFLCLKLWRGR